MTVVEKILVFWALSLPLLWIVLAFLKYREVKKARRIKNLENIKLFLKWRRINEQFPNSPEVQNEWERLNNFHSRMLFIWFIALGIAVVTILMAGVLSV